MSKLWLENSNHPVSQWGEVSPVGDWTDISNDICLVARWGLRAGLEDVYDLVKHLQGIYDGVWATKTDMEKICLASFCVAPKTDRDTVSFVPEVFMTGDYANHEFGFYDFVKPEFRESMLICDIEYKGTRMLTQRLQFKDNISYGLLVDKCYYETYIEATLTTAEIATPMLICIDTDYTLDAGGDMQERTKGRDFFLRDGTTVGATGTESYKPFTTDMSIDEGERRRRTIVNQLKRMIPTFIILTTGCDLTTARTKGALFFLTYKGDFKDFIDMKHYVPNPLKDIVLTITVANSAFEWIENDISAFTGSPEGFLIKHYLNDQLDYDGKI